MTAQKAASRTRIHQPAPKPPESTSGAPPSVSATGSAGTRATLWFGAKGQLRNGKMSWRYPPNTNERRRMHHMAEAREVGRWRREAAELGKYIGRHQRIRVSAVVYRARLGVADESGDAERLKPLVDGLVDARVVPNDTRKHVEYGPVTEARAVEYGRGVELIVEVLA